MEKKEMSELDKARNALLEMYKIWAAQLDDSLLTDDYSNPYYVSIPDDWFKSDNRIMIVGEEGAGEWGAGKTYGWKKDEKSWGVSDFDKIIEYNRIKMLKMIKEDELKEDEKSLCENKGGNFWKRFKKIYDFGYPCIWNNLDKIHRIKNGCVLSSDERQKLHSTHIKILAEEIRILNPTIVVFCGWNNRKDAFRLEFPENDGVYEKFFKKNNGKYECEQYKNEDKLYDIYYMKKDSITYILTKHPGWRGKCKPKNYEDTVLKIIYKYSKENN